MFSGDEKIAALLRSATACKDAGNLDEAIDLLRQAKVDMLVSPVSYPAETWCRLPLYLQRAGRMPEAVVEFQCLLEDLPRRARRDSRLDNSNVGPEEQKQRLYERLVTDDGETIRVKLALAKKREATRNRGEVK